MIGVFVLASIAFGDRAMLGVILGSIAGLAAGFAALCFHEIAHPRAR